MKMIRVQNPHGKKRLSRIGGEGMKRQVREKARILAGSNGPAGGPLAVSAEGPAMSGLGIGISRIAMFRLQAKNRSSGLQFRSCMNLNFICFK